MCICCLITCYQDSKSSFPSSSINITFFFVYLAVLCHYACSPVLGHGYAQAVSLKRKLLWHDVDRDWMSQPKNQNLITIMPGNLILASNIILMPKLAHILINFKNTNILPQSLPQNTFSHFSLFFNFQEVEISRERVLSHLDKVFLTSFFGISAWVTHQIR